MDVYPQIFDRQQTLILKPLIGHARLGGQRAGEPPWTFPAHADRNSGSQVSSKLCQLTNFGAAVAPLLPIALQRKPKSATYTEEDLNTKKEPPELPLKGLPANTTL